MSSQQWPFSCKEKERLSISRASASLGFQRDAVAKLPTIGIQTYAFREQCESSWSNDNWRDIRNKTSSQNSVRHSEISFAKEMEKKKQKSTLRSLKIATENYQFRYREKHSASSGLHKRMPADKAKPGCERTDTFDSVCEEFHGCFCKGRNAHHSEAMLSLSRAGWHHLQSRDNRQRKVLSFHYDFFILKPSLWHELKLQWIFCRFFFW